MVDPGVRGLVVEGQLVVDQGELLQHRVRLLRLFLEQKWGGLRFFFTPIPCAYTSSPLDGMARNFFFYITQFIVYGSILFLPPYTRGEEKHLV